MNSYHIVGANGQMGRPTGWTLPVIQDGEQCRVVGDSPNASFPASHLESLEQQGMICLFQPPIDFDSQIAEEEARVDIEFHEGLFSELLYVFYFDRALFEGVGIDISSLLLEPEMIVHPRNFGRSLDAYIVTRSSLIHALDAICERFDHQIMERFAEHDWAGSTYLVDDKLKLLTTSYYDSAYNRSVAIRAISLRALLLQASPNSHMLEEWLSAAGRRWEFDVSIEVWSKRMRSVIETCMTSAHARRLDHEKESTHRLEDLPR